MRLRDRFDRSKRKPSTRRQRIGFAFFWLLVLAYAYVIPQEANWNTESHLFLTFSLVDHHTPRIDAYHVRLGDESYNGGHYYTDKAPGLSLLAVPVYATLRALDPRVRGRAYTPYPNDRYSIPRDTVIIRYAITYVLDVLPSAILGVLLWLVLMSLGASTAWALALAGTYSLGTIAYVYSTQLFSHQVAAVLLFVAFYLIFKQVRASTDSGNRAYLSAGVAGLLAGYAVICEYPTALIAGALGVYLGFVARKRLRAVAAYVAGALPPAGAVIAYNLAAFGKPIANGYNYDVLPGYRNPVHAGALGPLNPASYGVQPPTLDSIWQITFGAFRGMFLISPVLLLFVVGVAFMWKRRDLRPELWLCVGVVVLYFLMDASRGEWTNGWSGGASVASRHLTPMLPFMVMPMAIGLRNAAFRVAFVVLGAASIALTFMAVMTGDEFSMTDQNPLVHEVFPRFFGGHLITTWGSLLTLNGIRSLLPLGLVAAALLARMAYLLGVSPARPAAPARLDLEMETP